MIKVVWGYELVIEKDTRYNKRAIRLPDDI
jgi:hypothetical protein